MYYYLVIKDATNSISAIQKYKKVDYTLEAIQQIIQTYPDLPKPILIENANMIEVLNFIYRSTVDPDVLVANSVLQAKLEDNVRVKNQIASLLDEIRS